MKIFEDKVLEIWAGAVIWSGLSLDWLTGVWLSEGLWASICLSPSLNLNLSLRSKFSYLRFESSSFIFEMSLWRVSISLDIWAFSMMAILFYSAILMTSNDLSFIFSLNDSTIYYFFCTSPLILSLSSLTIFTFSWKMK